MIANFQHWYYGEDGTNPLFRLRKMHKICPLLLLACVLFSIYGPVHDTFAMQMYSPAVYFTFLLCMGIFTRMLGPHWDIVIHMNRGSNALAVLLISIAVAFCLAWLVVPLCVILVLQHFPAVVEHTILDRQHQRFPGLFVACQTA